MYNLFFFSDAASFYILQTRANGIKVVLISGDQSATVAIAKKVDIFDENIYTNLDI